MTAIDDVIRRFQGRSVAVVGDVMLDHFLVGRVDRISPEAPVPVVRFDREEYRLGGAANVGHNIASLGGGAAIVGLVGADAAADELRRQLAAIGLDGRGLVADASRPTTKKMRVVTTRNQQVARIDHESDDDVTGGACAALVAAARAAIAASGAVILSDYRKGVVCPEIIAAAIDEAAARRVPLLVDPKVAQAERYRGASLITPNHHEAELMTQTTIRSSDDAARAARLLHERTGANVLITRGEHGMWIFDATAGASVEASLPAVAREVADVTGAGDTVIAVLALALAAGAPLLDAARLANAAAGLVVARFGPATVQPLELAAAVAAHPD
jgi:D-beta-D-heptose 7-phosphate kinase/D-beta-D-heptose 1-phosphate adenosyltransferase